LEIDVNKLYKEVYNLPQGESQGFIRNSTDAGSMIYQIPIKVFDFVAFSHSLIYTLIMTRIRRPSYGE
jgi:hypothetical protein